MSFSGLRFDSVFIKKYKGKKQIFFFLGWGLGFGLFLGGVQGETKGNHWFLHGFHPENHRKAIGFVMDFNQKP